MSTRPPLARPEVAMVLAAGLGTRMRPLTDMVPKPLIVLGGRPLLDHVLDRIGEAGIPRAVVNVHYRADQIEAHLARRRRPAITISDERDRLLETGGGLVLARPLLEPGPVLVHNSDTVWIEAGQSALGSLLGAWDGARMDCLLLLARRATSLGYDGRGDFDLDAAGRIARRQKERETPYVFAGVSILSLALLDGAPSGPFSLNRPWDGAIARGRAFGVVLEGTWMHVGDPAALALAEARIGGRHG